MAKPTKAEKEAAARAAKAAENVGTPMAVVADAAEGANVAEADTKDAEVAEQTEKKAKAPVAVEDKAKQLFYDKRAVISVSNKIVNGRLYKEVETVESKHLLTLEEFSKDVA